MGCGQQERQAGRAEGPELHTIWGREIVIPALVSQSFAEEFVLAPVAGGSGAIVNAVEEQERAYGEAGEEEHVEGSLGSGDGAAAVAAGGRYEDGGYEGCEEGGERREVTVRRSEEGSCKQGRNDQAGKES